MSDTLTAKEQSLAQIFSDEYVFTIPSYQRPYSWGEDQAQELLDDLSSAVAVAPDDLNDAQPYFLGSIVLIKAKASPEATVVDGQQRLTTLTLLLSALRESISNAQMQSDVTSCIYEKGNLARGTKPRYRLSLRERDREFFKDNVQHENSLKSLAASSDKLPDAQSRLRANGAFFLKELSRRSQDELHRLVQFIMIRCYLVSVSTPDLDSAYRIFGVLNSRGLDLSATDILKAEVIGAIDDDLRDGYTAKWEDKEEYLGRDEFSDLFSHIRMVYRKAKSQGTLLKEFREHVAPSAKPQLFMDEILLPMANSFGAICEANYESNKLAEKVNECLKWLNRLEFKDWVPPALAFFVRNQKNPESMFQFFKDLERLGYSMLARKTGVNNRIDRFSSLTDAIENELDLYSLGSPLQLTPIEQFETYAALNGPLYETHSARSLAVLLMRVDRLLSDASADYQHEVVSVEHVMPQQPAPNSQWLEWLPDMDKHQSWVHRLGNLTLLSRKKNSAASNFEFERKKSAYFTKGGITSFALTTQVLSFSKWTEDVLQSRQSQLLDALDTHWRLNDRLSKQQLAEKLLTELAITGGGVTFELVGIRHGLAAYAKDDGQSFTVLKGSMARAEWSGQPHTYQQLRDELMTTGILTSSVNGSCLVFTQDQVFQSPSAASATVLGRTDNGRNSWRLKGSAITYAAWQDNLPENQMTTGRLEV